MGLDDAIFDCIHDLKKGESERGKNQFINDLVWYAVSYLEDEIHGEDQKQLVKELEEKYTNLKMARIISINDNELRDTKQRLARLVREVDKCIALLNE